MVGYGYMTDNFFIFFGKDLWKLFLFGSFAQRFFSYTSLI